MERKIIIYLIIIIISLAFIFTFFLPIYPTDKSCKQDEDCAIIRSGTCNFLCYPSENDVYNKETEEEIKKLRETQDPYRRGICPVAECVFTATKHIPRCINNICSIEKVIDCEGICREYNTYGLNYSMHVSISGWNKTPQELVDFCKCI